ncbi:MAG: HAD family acid phosphatase [Gaiellales bacterium]
MLRTLIAAVVLALIVVPAASAAVVPQYFGSAAQGVPIIGSDAHLPPLAATGPFDAGPIVGDEIIKFRESGGYQADIRGVNSRARAYLKTWLDEQCGVNATVAQVRACHAMIVSDIDDTLISWYAYYADPAIDFQYVSISEAAAKQGCTPPAIKQTVALLQYAQSRGVAVTLMSGRTEGERATTVGCMQRIGFTGYRTLILRSPAEAKLSAQDYKSRHRRQLEQAGWSIAFSIGDQPSDMLGGSTDAGFLLPNPMYLIP